jgi:hypothetical protein
MRRLALLLATSLLGTGCIVSDHNDCGFGSFTVEWPSFQLADGSVTPSCGVAGVAYVDVFLNNALVQRFNCADGGAVVTGVDSASYLLTVEAVDSSGRILLRDEQQVGADRCADRLVQFRPSEGFVELSYAFVNNGTCITPGPSYLWFSIFDQVANATTVQIDQASPLGDQILYACGDQRGIVFPLPTGTYDLDWIEERQSPAFNVTGANCSRATFAIVPGQQTVVSSVLADTTVACP